METGDNTITFFYVSLDITSSGEGPWDCEMSLFQIKCPLPF